MTKALDLKGERFARLVVVERHSQNTKAGKARWICNCDCGRLTVVTGNDLTSGNTQSCGCYHNEIVTMLGKNGATHKMSKTRPYRIWVGMIQRCNNAEDVHFVAYGGRGITICDKWLTFQGFWEDMGPTYQNGLSIDRINNDGDYCKDNCRWADGVTQCNNRRGNVVFVVDGRRDTLKNLCRFYDKSYSAVHARIRRGWNIEQALTAQCKEFRQAAVRNKVN